jgi:GntR family transcriptional repressor for pyruvate dehydrogenase complex
MESGQSFERIAPRKVYQQINGQLQDMILSGQLRMGDRLPAERQLADRLGVSRNSIRESLRSLEILGLVESRQGDGTFIVDHIETSCFEPLSVLFRLHNGSFSDILEIRLILEVEAAALAAQRIDADGRRQLSSLLAELKASTDEAHNIALDRDIHYHIAKASGNYLVLMFLEGISFILTRHIKDARQAILTAMNQQGILVDIHSAVVDAILTTDPEGARTSMKRHFEAITTSLPYLAPTTAPWQ